jgi:hypothetical protein
VEEREPIASKASTSRLMQKTTTAERARTNTLVVSEVEEEEEEEEPLERHRKRPSTNRGAPPRTLVVGSSEELFIDSYSSVIRDSLKIFKGLAEPLHPESLQFFDVSQFQLQKLSSRQKLLWVLRWSCQEQPTLGRQR